MKRFWKRLRRRRELDRDLEDELAFHLEQSGDRARFGNPTVLRESIRDMWAFTSIEVWWQDIRCAVRTLAQHPGVNMVAVLAIALGIGANTTVFTIVHSALSFDMGVGSVDRLVFISATDAAGRNPFTAVPVYADLESRMNVSLPADLTPLIYLPYRAQPERVMFVAVRGRVPPAALAAAFRKEVQQLDPDLAVYDIDTLETRVARNRLEVGAMGAMFSVFALVALALASVGLYAVVAHAVSQRTREIGIRMALGGTEAHVLKLVFAQGMGQVAVGLAIGLPVAFAVARMLRAILVDVAPGDPITFAAVILVLMLAGFLGCLIPAQRAARVDPVDALRHE
jgi:hypothetical protein